MANTSPFRCPNILFGPFRWHKSFSVFSRTRGVTSEIFLNIACPEKRKKWVVFPFEMRSAFLLQNGVLKKIYLSLFDKKTLL